MALATNRRHTLISPTQGPPLIAKVVTTCRTLAQHILPPSAITLASHNAGGCLRFQTPAGPSSTRPLGQKRSHKSSADRRSQLGARHARTHEAILGRFWGRESGNVSLDVSGLPSWRKRRREAKYDISRKAYFVTIVSRILG